MDSFEFEYGRVLENVEVYYSTYGTPKYDDEGFIVNAILFSSTFSGEYSFLSGAHEHIKNNRDFDSTAEFYFIVIHSLGSPNSCSPSSTGLKHNFPRYTFRDIVNFKRQFLEEKFNIKKILGLIGEGVGGFDVLTWACEYPDEMEFIFVANSSFKMSGYKYILAKAFENIIESSDDVYEDTYSSSLSKILVAINTLIFAHSSSKKAFSNIDNNEIDALLDDFIDEGLFLDVYDFKYRNECQFEYNLEDKLGKIKAKSLFISTNHNYFEFEDDLLPLEYLVEDSIVICLDSVKEDYYFKEEDYVPVVSQILAFLEPFKK